MWVLLSSFSFLGFLILDNSDKLLCAYVSDDTPDEAADQALFGIVFSEL